MQRKVLASSYQHLMAEAPRFPGSGIDIRLYALNLTGTLPPWANIEQSYDGFTHDPKGRRFKVGADLSLRRLTAPSLVLASLTVAGIRGRRCSAIGYIRF